MVADNHRGAAGGGGGADAGDGVGTLVPCLASRTSPGSGHRLVVTIAGGHVGSEWEYDGPAGDDNGGPDETGTAHVHTGSPIDAGCPPRADDSAVPAAEWERNLRLARSDANARERTDQRGGAGPAEVSGDG